MSSTIPSGAAQLTSQITPKRGLSSHFDPPRKFDPRFDHDYIEIKSYNGCVQHHEKTINNEDLVGLCAAPPDPSAAWTAKFLVTNYDVASWSEFNIPFSPEAVQSLQDYWNIHNIGYSLLTHDVDIEMVISLDFQDPLLRGLYMAPHLGWNGLCAITVVHNAQSRTTHGICFGVIDDLYQAILIRLRETRFYAFHPLLMPLIVVDLDISELMNGLDQNYDLMNGITEDLVGRDFNRQYEALSVTNGDVSRRLTFLASGSASRKRLCTQKIRLLSRMKDEFGSWGQKGERIHDDDSDLVMLLSILSQRSEGLKDKQEEGKDRIQASVQQTYSLLAQKDNQLNHRYGADMRIIAAVTLVFLPGTFMATFFSASFWNFQPSNTGPIVSKWIWLYWVVTSILTIIVWYTWRGYSQMKALWQKTKRRFGKINPGDEETGNAGGATGANKRKNN